MNVAATGDDPLDLCQIKLAARAVNMQQLGAVGEKLRRAALVRLDMSQIVADDTMVGAAERRQRQ